MARARRLAVQGESFAKEILSKVFEYDSFFNDLMGEISWQPWFMPDGKAKTEEKYDLSIGFE